MEDKTFFESDTAWPFPIIKYTVNTSYVEVRKASGIAYILLQLISSSENDSEKLVARLNSLDVPNDIHYIFASELAFMISIGIINMKSNRDFGVDLMSIYQISDFKITELGKKLFEEGTIPTNNEQTKHINVYYDVSKKDTQIEFEKKLFELEYYALDKSCVGNVVLNHDDVEMFINENMSKYEFKKGERISGFKHEVPEFLAYKMDDAVTLKISKEGVQIHAKDKDRNTFIYQFYSADIITKIMNTNCKYLFPDFLAPETKEYNFNDFNNIIKLYMPSQMAIITNIKSTFSLGGKCEMHGSEYVLDSNEAIELMQKCNITGVACYFENGNLYSIIPGRFFLDVNGCSGKCAINLIAVQQLNESTKKQLMKEIFLKCLDTSDPFERRIIIKHLTKISHIKDYLEQFANFLVRKKKSCTEKIELFIKLNDEFIEESEWSDYSKVSAESLFNELCDQITVDGFAAQNILGKKLNNIIGLNNFEYISKISKGLVNSKGDVIAFETLEGAGLNIDIVLSVINIFDLYCNQIIEGVHISGNSKLSKQCTLLGQSLSELRELTSIYNPFDDSAKLDFDQERFIQVMSTFTDSMKKIEKYKAFAIEKYKTLSFFQERFIDIKQMVMIEKEANRNSKNINKKYIEQMLKKSRYKDAICDLHVRLQFELNRLFNTEAKPTFELLLDKNISHYLNENEVNQMHALRKCRNGFQHPKSKRDVQYSEKDIREWCSIVEKLGGMSDESRSEN